MSILTVNNLSHNFGGRELLKDVNFRIQKGEHIGLVGANGEGKSSFIKIITGKLQPDEGDIKWSKHVQVGYLDQHADLDPEKTIRNVLEDAFEYLFDIEAKINDMYMQMADLSEEEINSMLEEIGDLQDLLEQHDFYLINAKVEEIANGMGVSEFGLDNKVDTLSGGQRSKVLLAKMLLQKPDILLLDEPTNHLDINQIEWLRRFLQNYENAFVLISHDIQFLDSVINLIWHVENAELNRYPGNYDNFQRVYEAKKLQLEAAYKRQQQEIADLQDFVSRNKARVSTRNMAMSRQKKLDKMEVIELMHEKPKPEFEFKGTGATSKVIFETENLVIGYDKPLSKPLNLRMERGDRVLLSGANGLGKTTLIKTLLGIIPPYSGKIHNGQNLHIGYFAQEENYSSNNSTIEEMWEAFPTWNQHEIRSALARCGLTKKLIESKITVLSGGEQAKVRLCKIMNKETNILFMDEPTNHLDVDAQEELKRAILDYNGGILMVSHDITFIEEMYTKKWKMEDFI
ncbi:MAG: ABC-F family ATP-binding cassette domain-containing protein [Eubacteriales bacterium]|nr:ABC-F family ATP-binding cassette domain-containing protein [Eubacteriales bacterium]MDY3332949.1 ABC-F family ATP-binding cassette domain-containing protein [Gallibacter sp.]